MPLVDMSIEQLFKYKGVSPCPKDIDEYWDAALAEMNSVSHNAEFVKKEFPSKAADMYDLYYRYHWAINNKKVNPSSAVGPCLSMTEQPLQSYTPLTETV